MLDNATGEARSKQPLPSSPRWAFLGSRTENKKKSPFNNLKYNLKNIYISGWMEYLYE